MCVCGFFLCSLLFHSLYFFFSNTICYIFVSLFSIIAGNDIGNRKRTKSKVSPQNVNHHYNMYNQNSGSRNFDPRKLDEWLNRNSTGNLGYEMNVDEWLNTTMKESPKTFSASSTEFLDSNRAAAINGVNSANAAVANVFRLVPELQVNILAGVLP